MADLNQKTSLVMLPWWGGTLALYFLSNELHHLTDALTHELNIVLGLCSFYIS